MEAQARFTAKLECAPGGEPVIQVRDLLTRQESAGGEHAESCSGWPGCETWRVKIYENSMIGIDSGTQSTKVLVVDAKNGNVLGSAPQAYDLIPDLPPGAKEQHPHTWRDATAKAIRQALRQAKASAGEVKAIGVSGQQHGFVPLDEEGRSHSPGETLVRHLHGRGVR